MLARHDDNELDRGPKTGGAGSERLCAATRTIKPVDEMIRFVVTPDGGAVADIKRNLPGRGIWITATRAAIADAIKRNVFARGFKRDVRVASDMVEITERLLERAALNALAIAGKAGDVVAGFAKVEAAIARGRVVALLHASDGAGDGIRKLDAAWRRQLGDAAEAIAIIDAFTSAQLDLALGRPNVVHAALFGGPASDVFFARFKRLEHFRAGTPDRPEQKDRQLRGGQGLGTE
jgi:predicted RNA-binding protein YlxR (DUF448 family)